jgi:cobyrinic acid a,c-diamide synthase
MATLGPRIVIAGTHSGVGKTTVATGVMAALASRGLRVAAAKVGPDFIDPSYHAIATGRQSHSLDAFLSGDDLLPGLAGSAAKGADILVIEGVMGLFDGSGQPGCDGSTAALSRILDAPVVLVVDASAMSGSVAAIVHGFATLDDRVRLAGIVLNRVGSEGHALLLREALEPIGIPVLGIIFQRDDLVWRERHLGLMPVAEDPEAVRSSVDCIGEVVGRSLDLDALVRLATMSPTRNVSDPPRAKWMGNCRLAVCGGPAFSFVYPENVELFKDAGAEIVVFDPLTERSLPQDCDALYAGGGFPELFAEGLGANRSLLEDVRVRVKAGMPTLAECGGLLWLCASLDDTPMAGALANVHAQMSERLTIGYRMATTRRAGIFGPKGTALRGHEFHRSTTTPHGDALDLSGRFGSGRGGFSTLTLQASYLHQHLSATPELAERFIAVAAARELRTLPTQSD